VFLPNEARPKNLTVDGLTTRVPGAQPPETIGGAEAEPPCSSERFLQNACFFVYFDLNFCFKTRS